METTGRTLIDKVYHVPVLLEECLNGLDIREDGIYADATFGGGGHSAGIISRLKSGRLLAFDQDPDAAINALKAPFNGLTERSFTLVAANFRYMRKYLRIHGVEQADGIMADLGISSHQIDTPERGFSFRFDAALDMRMDKSSPKSAREVLNEFEENRLVHMFSLYGEVQNSKRLANAVIRFRAKKSLMSIADLTAITNELAPRGMAHKYNAQVFQAIRIEVNDELKALEEWLLQMPECIKPGGRLVVLTYHSLEDRLVKHFIREGRLEGEAEKDLYGNVTKPFEAVNRKPIEAGETEVSLNPRARSAKLRVATRL